MSDEDQSFNERLATVETAVKSIQGSVASIEAKLNRPQNIVGWGALVISLVATGGTYINTRITPIERSVVNNDQRLEQRAATFGQFTATDKYHNEVLNELKIKQQLDRERVDMIAERVAALEAVRAADKEQLRDVDILGSRKWLDRSE